MDKGLRQESGFTLIELLVVVLIIGILASIAIPQYFKVVERARVAEARAFIGDVRSAQERYYAKAGAYVTVASSLNNLDLNFAGGATAWGMKNFSVSAMAASTCNTDAAWTVTLTRGKQAGGTSPPPRYGSYTVVYTKCTGNFTIGSCPGGGDCNGDLM